MAQSVKEYVVPEGNYPQFISESDIHYVYALELDKIFISNNEIFTLDLSSINVLNLETNDKDTDKYSKIYKAVIDWGDGKKDTVFKSIEKKVNTLGVAEPVKWDIVEHKYSMKEYIDYTQYEKTPTVIKINCFNVYGTCFKFEIPFEILYKSLPELGTEFKIISANIRNDGNTSYVLKHVATDSIVVVRSND